MPVRQLIVMLLFVVMCSPAQGEGAGATDNELFAGYCFGMLQTMDQQSQFVKDTTLRFRNYLVARGALGNPQRTQAGSGVLIAIGRGQAESRQCMRTCYDDPTMNGDAQRACTHQNQACQRGLRCFMPDALPF